jgi:hypothetical protein
MKIFDTIKKHISSFLNDFKAAPINKVDSAKKEPEKFIGEKLADNDGSCEMKLHSIHEYEHKGKYDITEPQIDEILKKILSSNNILRLEKKLVLLDMYGDCLVLHKALLPLIELNIAYSIDVVGGSVRDFLLDKHREIKDLDILINLTPGITNVDYYSRHFVNSQLLNTKLMTEKEWCSKEELEAVDFSDKDELYSKHNKLVKVCLNRNHEVVHTQIFTKNERTKTGELLYGEEILKELSGIIKVESKGFKYPIELLLTDRGTERFYSNIDFGICNVGLRIINLDKDNYLDLVSIHDVRDNFVISTDFLEDVKDKTITYNTYNRSFDQIEYSFKNHLKRVQAKYPEYKLSFSKNVIDEETKKCIDTVRTMDELSEELVTSEQALVKPRKNKL